MTTRLKLYNDALLLFGERSIATLNDEAESRRLLDQVWNSNGVDGCLEQAQWAFAMRTVQIDYDTTVTPDYGFARAFSKPTDWILTSAVCSDEFFRVPVLRYVDETGYWYSDLDTLYVRFVSNGSSYGGDLSLWPTSFKDYVAAVFASKIVLKITGSKERLRMFVNPDNPQHSIVGRALLHAKNKCAMASPTQMSATGSWSNSRIRGVNRRDGGSISGNLY